MSGRPAPRERAERGRAGGQCAGRQVDAPIVILAPGGLSETMEAIHRRNGVVIFHEIASCFESLAAYDFTIHHHMEPAVATMPEQPQQTVDLSRVLQAASPNRFRGIRHSVTWDPHPEVENSAAHKMQGQMASDQFRAGARVLARMGLTLEGWAYHPQLPELAAFANGVMVRYLDGNDAYPGGGGHPSDVIAAVLAAADACNAEGRTLVTGIALAYEVYYGLWRATELRSKGMDNVYYTAVGGAAGAAKVLGLDRARTVEAMLHQFGSDETLVPPNFTTTQVGPPLAIKTLMNQASSS